MQRLKPRLHRAVGNINEMLSHPEREEEQAFSLDPIPVQKPKVLKSKPKTAAAPEKKNEVAAKPKQKVEKQQIKPAAAKPKHQSEKQQIKEAAAKAAADAIAKMTKTAGKGGHKSHVQASSAIDESDNDEA